MAERYIPDRLRKMLKNMTEPYFDWLGSPLDGGLEYDEIEKQEIEKDYGIKIDTHQNGYNYYLMQPSYKVTVQKGNETVSFGSSQEIPKKWKFRLRLKK